MTSQVEKSDIKSLLQMEGSQQATGRIRSLSLLEEMSLIGFIPYMVCYNDAGYENYRISNFFNMNTKLIVTPNLIRFPGGEPIPVFRHICSATGKSYKLDEHFLIDTLFNDVAFVSEKTNLTILKGNKIIKAKGKQDYKKISILFNENNECIYYIGRENEIELTQCYNGTTCISSDFLCLCTYMNKVTGRPSYVVLSSEDTVRVLPQSFDE